MPAKDSDSRYSIQVAAKVLDVLFAFTEPPHAHSLGDLCRMTGLPKNQVFRCLKTLEGYGLLRTDYDGRYRLTALIRKFASVAVDDANLIEIARPVMDDLAARTGETVNLLALMDDMAVVLDRRESSKGVRLSMRVGSRAPLHAGAVPKAILAFLPPEQQSRVLSMVPFLPKHTERTVTDPVQLQTELETIRRQGYAISDEDVDVGARGVGAPIFNAEGQVIAGISAGGPVTRVTYEMLPWLADLVVEAAWRVSRQLGYLPRPAASPPPPLEERTSQTKERH